MSWPSGDWAPPSDGMSSVTDEQGRPVDVASLATFNYRGRHPRAVRQTREQVELSLRQLSVPFDSLPQLPGFARLIGFSNDWHKKAVALQLANFAAREERVLTPAEADALAYHLSRSCATRTWELPATSATALFMVYRGRKTFRFPFYTPKPASFNPWYFPLLSLTGVGAQRAWHVARLCAYGLACWMVIPISIKAASDLSFTMGVLSEPALRSIITKYRRGTQLPDREATPPQPFRGGYEARGPVADRPEPPPPQQQQQQQPTPQWPSPAASDAQGTPKDDDGFLIDDASPVAPSQRQQERPRRPTGSPPPQSTGEGSAWERLRQRAKSGEDVWNQGGQQKTEEYTYASSEQEKAYAKEQAQKEFDAMLERERRGVGESGGGDPTRRL